MEYQEDIIRLVDLATLVPVLNRYKLLTTVENSVLTDMTVVMAPQEHCRQLTQFMAKKGDKGYQLFLQLLQEEKQHLGHNQLYQLLPSSSASTGSSQQSKYRTIHYINSYCLYMLYMPSGC